MATQSSIHRGLNLHRRRPTSRCSFARTWLTCPVKTRGAVAPAGFDARSDEVSGGAGCATLLHAPPSVESRLQARAADRCPRSLSILSDLAGSSLSTRFRERDDLSARASLHLSPTR